MPALCVQQCSKFIFSQFSFIDLRKAAGLSGLVLSGLIAITSLPPHSFAAELPPQLKGHGGPIKSISISADGKYALTASFDYNIILWDMTSKEGKIIHRLTGHDNAVNDAVFSADNKRAISVSDDGSLGIWDLQKGILITRIKAEADKVLDVTISPNGKIAAVARWDKTVRLYNLDTHKEIAIFKGHRGNVNSVAFSADGTRLYSAAYDGQIIEWDVKTAKPIRPIYKYGWGINSIARVDRDRLIFGAIDGAVGLVSISKAEKVADLAKRERPIQSVKVSQDMKLMAFGDGAGRIEVFQVEDAKKIEATNVAYGPVWDFDFMPATFQIYHVGLDDFATRWQIAPHKLSKIESKYPRRFQVRKTNDPGELEFSRKCSVCHTLTPDGANRAGPTLYGLFGRKAGTLPGYAFSKALLNSNVIWNETTVAQLFDDGPDVMLPGTKMPIQRLKSVERRDDLIRYLKIATAVKP